MAGHNQDSGPPGSHFLLWKPKVEIKISKGPDLGVNPGAHVNCALPLSLPHFVLPVLPDGAGTDFTPSPYISGSCMFSTCISSFNLHVMQEQYYPLKESAPKVISPKVTERGSAGAAGVTSLPELSIAASVNQHIARRCPMSLTLR